MTADALKGDRERRLDASMDDYVSKPLEPDLLFEAIERFFPSTAGGPRPSALTLHHQTGGRCLLKEIEVIPAPCAATDRPPALSSWRSYAPGARPAMVLSAMDHQFEARASPLPYSLIHYTSPV